MSLYRIEDFVGGGFIPALQRYMTNIHKREVSTFLRSDITNSMLDDLFLSELYFKVTDEIEESVNNLH